MSITTRPPVGLENPGDRRIGEPRYGGTLRLLGPGGVDHLDTASAYYATSGQVLRALTRQLFAYPASSDLSDPQRSFTPVADIAAVVPTRRNRGISEDGLTYTVYLRPDVHWDTTPPRAVTAHDFVRGFKRLGNPVTGAGAIGYFTSTIRGMREYCETYLAAFAGKEPTAESLAEFQNTHEIPGVRAIDDRTLEFRLIQPANDFLNILAMGFASPAPVEYDALLPDSREFRENLRSTGPYRMDRYVDDGREMRFSRNPAWEQQSDLIRSQFVDAIEIRACAEPAEVIRQKLDSSEIDLAWSFTAVSWAKTPPERDAALRSFPGYALNPYLVFNLRSPNAGGAMQNVLVRRAIAYAINKAAVGEILSVLDAPNKPLHGVIPPGSSGHRAYNPYPTPNDQGDPVKARQLLDEAGYGAGFSLIAAVRKIGIHLKVMESVADDLEKIGIGMTVNTYSQAEYYGSLLSDPEKGRAGAWDIAEPGWTPDWFGNNGRSIVQPLFETNDAPGTTNYGGYSNPEVDRLIAEALREPDPARADELWHLVDRRVMEDVAVVPILAFAAMTSRYHSPRVRNAVHVPQIEFFDITNIWLDPVG
jgi:peptide/nickel transport system substrate-binding protein